MTARWPNVRLLRFGIALWVLGSLVGGCRTLDHESSQVSIVGGYVLEGLPAVGMVVRDGKLVCTGTLITPTRVMTAAHCIDPKDAANLYSFQYGPRWGDAKALTVKSKMIHPLYEAEDSVYDLAYLDLTTPAPFEPISAVTEDISNWEGRELLLVGYGASKGSVDGRPREGSGIKRAVVLPIAALNDGKIKFDTVGKSACNGDSGGPALVDLGGGRYQVVGVSSCGDKTCTSYGVYTRVDRFGGFLGVRALEDQALRVNNCGNYGRQGRCEGTELVSCDFDCFAAVVRRENCADRSGGSCYTTPGTNQARCIGPQHKNVTLRLREIRIVNGQYDTSKPAAGVEVFFDRIPVDAMTTGGLISNAEGEVKEMLESGERSFIARRWASSHALAITEPQKLRVSMEGAVVEWPISLEPARIEAVYQTLPGEALYLTGQGLLLGDWKRARRMRLNEGVWVYEGTLPQGIAFKVVVARDGGAEINTEGVRWEQGANHILTRTPPHPQNKARFTPRF